MLQKITKQAGKHPDCPILRLIAAHQALKWRDVERYVALPSWLAKGTPGARRRAAEWPPPCLSRPDRIWVGYKFFHFFVAKRPGRRHILKKKAHFNRLYMPLALRRTDRRRTGSAGFTLLELLVVICIAGVLMALLLPALSQAKEKSRRSVCNQNIRQVILGLTMYADADPYERLPLATDIKGGYHSIRLSSVTFSNLVEPYLSGESNSLYCPNLVYDTGTMGGYDPLTDTFTIGYSYLAAQITSAGAKGPSLVWTGPVKATENIEVIADANYWSTTDSQAMTLAPHTLRGSLVASAAILSTSSPASTSPTAGSPSTAMGAMGGNIGSLNGSVIWRPIRLMSQYPASTDGSALGNW